MEIKKMQNLLQYLDYYTDRVDGINGPQTEAAVAAFRQANGNPNLGDELDEVLIGAVFHGKFKTNQGTAAAKPTSWDGVKYFGRHEFACKCGKCGGYPVEPSMELLGVLDKLREIVGLPVYINSGVRCKAHNTAVGGAYNSRHTHGDAADIRCPGKTPRQLYDIADKLLPKGGVGLYSWGIHVDTRGAKARWNG